MNKLTIIGNLTKAPELRQTSTGIQVCTFTVAVNRRGKKEENSNQPDADFFRVSAWRQLAEICSKYLEKGRKVCVVGAVSLHTYTRSDGQAGASLEVNAEDVEFLSGRNDNNSDGGAASAEAPAQAPADPGYTAVETDELPFDRRVSLPVTKRQ